MKKTLFILTIAFLVTPCNGDAIVPSSEKDSALVARISRNGLTQSEFFYDIDKRLLRHNIYYGGSIATYTLYEYDDNGIKEMRRHTAEDQALIIRVVFTYDNFGRIIKADNFRWPDYDKEVGQVTEFEYNTSGQLVAQEYGSFEEPPDYREEYAYDHNGNLITRRRRVKPNRVGEYVSFQHDYTPGAQSLPDAWKQYVFILGVPVFHDDLRNVFNTEVHSKYWNDAKVLTYETSREFSGQVFDDDGNLVYRISTQKNILHPENPDMVSVLSYDYSKESGLAKTSMND